VETPTDIFPNIGVPVIGVAWQYTGLPPDDHGGRESSTPYEAPRLRRRSTTSNISRAHRCPAWGIVKIYFEPTVDIRTATAQVTLDLTDHSQTDAARCKHHRSFEL